MRREDEQTTLLGPKRAAVSLHQVAASILASFAVGMLVGSSDWSSWNATTDLVQNRQPHALPFGVEHLAIFDGNTTRPSSATCADQSARDELIRSFPSTVQSTDGGPDLIDILKPVPSTQLKKPFVSDTTYKTILSSMPIPTVDVMIFSVDCQQTLLFKRTNKPIQNVWYSLGGRVMKNEMLVAAAQRLALKETNLDLNATQLTLGGVNEEIFADSAIDEVNSHCINTVFGMQLMKPLTTLKMDNQNSQAKWFNVSDSELHPFITKKIALLKPSMCPSDGQ